MSLLLNNKLTMNITPCVLLYYTLCAAVFLGYGDVTPKTNRGKILLIFFAGVGIPLTLWLLALCGQIQTAFHCKVVRFISKTVARLRQKRDNADGNTKILAIGVTLVYIFVTGIISIFLIQPESKWSYVDCTYYWFCTVTTIGYGDLTIRPHAMGNILYWLILKILGLALMAGFINSCQQFLQEARLKKLKTKSKVISHMIRRKTKYNFTSSPSIDGVHAKFSRNTMTTGGMQLALKTPDNELNGVAVLKG